MKHKKQVDEIIIWGRRLNERGYVSARGGNISYKVDDHTVLITAHDCYLGFLQENDVVEVDLKNPASSRKDISSERPLHLEIQKRFGDVKTVIHAHSPYTTAFFEHFSALEMFSFEVKFYLGNVKVLPQDTPTVTQVEPVIKALEDTNIVVLKNHGVVAVGKDLKEAFSLIELLEEQAKVNFAIAAAVKKQGKEQVGEQKSEMLGTYDMLSQQHIDKLVELVNNDKEAQELGKKYGLTCTLAVKNQDNGRAVCFYYENGRIVKADNSDSAEFVIIGPQSILKKVFNREIDPFVATTQGKVKTKGDFSKMSRWYPVMVRTFALWEKAPVK